jgi:LacI family transcriptional regulator
VSVVGFNDMPYADRVSPPLTTVRVPQYDLGRRAAALLLETIKDPSRRPVTERIPPELVVRDSTRAPRASGLRPAQRQS